jgi:hypothetical protein
MTHIAPTELRAHLVPSDLAPSRPAPSSPGISGPPVFLHCGWRTRGTWLWNRFRALDGVTAYYEPLAELLVGMRATSLASFAAQTWASGHRGVSRPYFEEFLPLLAPSGRGVQDFDLRFAVEDFFAAPDAALPELAAYLRRLIAVAQAAGAQPVLKLCRSVGRIGWMQRAFPEAVHIVVQRNPLGQFGSALRQYGLHGNTYFLAMPLLLLATNQHLPDVASAVRHLAVALPDLSGGTSQRARLAVCEATLRDRDAISLYRGFLAFWLLTTALVPDGVDGRIDTDLLARDEAARAACGTMLECVTGRAVDFVDAEAPVSCLPFATQLPRDALEAAHEGAAAFLAGRLGPDWARNPSGRAASRLLARAEALHARESAASLSGRAAHGQPASGAPASGAAESGGTAKSGADAQFQARLLSAMGRAVLAERELEAVYASHSWKLTAPLRWMVDRLSRG